jgi:hypothetical protein
MSRHRAKALALGLLLPFATAALASTASAQPATIQTARAQSGTISPTSSGVIHGQGWQRGQDLSSFGAQRDAARARALARHRPQVFTGLPQRSRTP